MINHTKKQEEISVPSFCFCQRVNQIMKRVTRERKEAEISRHANNLRNPPIIIIVDSITRGSNVEERKRKRKGGRNIQLKR